MSDSDYEKLLSVYCVKCGVYLGSVTMDEWEDDFLCGDCDKEGQ